MIRFLFKGIISDRSRSVLPALVVALGVALTVLLTCWIEGILIDSVRMTANFQTGHVRVMTRAFAEDESQLAAELGITEIGALKKQLSTDYPDYSWVERIRFGALVDFPDENGQTRVQGPVLGWSFDLFSPESMEAERFNLRTSLVTGRIPSKPGEALITHDFAERFKVSTGDVFTLFGTTMEGSMAFRNFMVAGTVKFGTAVMDKGSIIIDITDAQEAFLMQDGATEILGFHYDNEYYDTQAAGIASSFNRMHEGDDSEFAPIMVRLKEQGGMTEYLDIADLMRFILVFVFVLAMSVVLWNTGLLGGLRRYTEFGLRLAMGEEKKHIYRTLLLEGVIIGMIGSVVGTLTGLGVSWYLQEVGFRFDALQGSSMMFPTIIRAKLVPAAWYIGFIPGVIAMMTGNALSGRGIYKRQTAQLFKELEV